MFFTTMIIDFLFLFDVLVTFRTVIDEGTHLITDSVQVAKKYAKGFLFIDIVSSLPYDLILLSVCASAVNGANRLLRYVLATLNLLSFAYPKLFELAGGVTPAIDRIKLN